MKKTSSFTAVLLQVILPGILVIIIDQVTKQHGGEWTQLNRGIIGGMFSDASHAVKVLNIFSIFFLISALFFFIQFLILKIFRALSLLCSLLYFGFLSNVLDKLTLGGVVDFIPVKIGDRILVMNVADIFQQVAVLGIVIFLIKDGKKLWPAINLRRTWFIDSKFQVASALFVGVFSVVTGCATAVLSYLFFSSLQGHVSLSHFIIFVSVFLVLLSFVISLCALVFFNRAAGPVYSAKGFIRRLTAGERPELRFREHDFFKELEDELNELSKRL